MWQGLRRSVFCCLLRHAKSLHCQANFKTTEKQTNFQVENYFKKLQWKSRDEFASSLINSVFFSHDGLIALNKPYGVAVYKYKGNVPETKTRDRLSRSLFPESKYSVEDAIPALMEHFNFSHLEIVKSTERFTTGVCLLASRKSAVGHIKAAITRSAAAKIPYQTYWAITRGSLSPPMASMTVGLKMISVEGQGLEPEIILEPTRRQMKMKTVKPVRVEHRVLSTNHDFDVALCEVLTRSNKAHFVRVYCIHRSSCVLGDALYSPRLRTVLGRTVVLSPRNYNKNVDPLPTLKDQVIKTLGLHCSPGDEMAYLPVLLHLWSLNLTNWNKGQDLVITAPLPEHFKWACERLKLDTFPLAIPQ